MYLTITDNNANIEIVKVTAITPKTNKLTVVRGQEGTTNIQWHDGAIITQRVTAGNLTNFIQKGAYRTVTYDPNGILTGAYVGEKILQSNSGGMWWKNISGTIWQRIAGKPVATLIYYDNDDQGLITEGRPYYDGSFLYVPFCNAGGNSGIYTYSISENALSLEQTLTINPTAVVARGVCSDGTYLIYGYNLAGAFIGSGTVNGLGVITPVNYLYTGTTGGSLDLWYDGTFVYMLLSDKLISFTLDGAGAFTLKDSVSPSVNSSGGKLWHDGNFLYCMQSSNDLIVYSVDANGVFSQVDSDSRGDNDVTGDGTFIFVSNGATGIEVFEPDGAGNLFHRSTYDSLSGSVGALMYSNGYLIAEDSSGNITTLSVNGLGVLSYVAEFSATYYATMTGMFSSVPYVFQNTSSVGTNLMVWE